MKFFYKESKSKKKKKPWRLGGEGMEVWLARVSDFFPSLKTKCNLFEGVKVRENRIV